MTFEERITACCRLIDIANAIAFLKYGLKQPIVDAVRDVLLLYSGELELSDLQIKQLDADLPPAVYYQIFKVLYPKVISRASKLEGGNEGKGRVYFYGRDWYERLMLGHEYIKQNGLGWEEDNANR